ncbi:unnamed protein product [Peniophora sp. CBMAI 1063]|nr:unnamed protein product [Peniophora sp. CBMAI 1063]
MSTSAHTERTDSKPHGRDTLYEDEQWWASRYLWLLEHGYMLRPRFRPNWSPSWIGTKKDPREFEDGQFSLLSNLLDATARDGTFVMLKRIDRKLHPYEVDITTKLSSPELQADPRNRSIPVLEVLDIVPEEPDSVILVTPLMSAINQPVIETIGEFVAFYTQVLEGLQFLHSHHIAHRDFFGTNMVMDATPLYSAPFHPLDPSRRRDWSGKTEHCTRTERPVRYYIIDYGISRQFEGNEANPLVPTIIGADKSVPEHQGMRGFQPCNPFATDIYTAGNTVNEFFASRAQGFDFMQPLVSDMMQDDPSKRPTIDEVVQRFEELRSTLSVDKLRSRVVDRLTMYPSFSSTRVRLRKLVYTLTKTPPIPDPHP